MKLPICLILLLFYGTIAYTLTFQYDSPCATLFKEENYEGQNFSVEQDSSLGSLETEHQNTESGWNVTKSWIISEGCSMKVCNESYFTGTCQTYNESTSTISNQWLKLGIDSVKCTCAKNCKCSDVQMRSTSCARAYLTTSCNVCNPRYTNLKGIKDHFNFEDPVKSLIIRNGCSLTIYEDIQYEGDSMVYTQNVEEAEEIEIGSYECECDPNFPYEKPPKIINENFPKMIELPNSVENLTQLMNGPLERHPALLSALQSVKNKRSSKNAYILLLGITGSGKSTAINLLFDNPNVTKVGAGSSTTAAIHEFRILVQSDELGIGNGELRVIDTPGLGDTGGLDRDARFLATLDEFIANHEELKDPRVIPNVILIFHKFHDNRYDGVGSNFVKVLRGFDAFRTRITDKHYSNVIFVFTHFASETKSIRRYPKRKLMSFKKVIGDYSEFPKPITMVVAENKPEAQELKMVNGYVELENGEYYPKNLFDKIQTVTAGGGDPIGGAIIASAFRDSSEFNISRSDMELVFPDNVKVTKYLHDLTGAFYDIEGTQISELIKNAFEKMPEKLQKRFPTSKHYLQKAMNLKNIRTLEDTPKTTLTVVQLLTSLKLNEANLFILENGLNLKPPNFKENPITGYSYNVFKDIPLLTSPINLGILRSSEIGFTFPSAFTCNIIKKNAQIFQIFDNTESYLNYRLQSLSVDGKIPLNEFKGDVRAGCNIKNVTENTTTITAVREFRNFQLELNNRLNLRPEFIKALKSLEMFNETSHKSVEAWRRFFNDWGTHVVKSAYGGGAIEIHLTSEISSSSANDVLNTNMAEALYELVQFAEDITIGRRNQNKTFSQDDVKHTLKFRGGNQAYHTTDLTKMKLSDAANLIENWIESLDYNPTILTSEFRLLPISQVAKKVGQNISSEIERATELLFQSKLTYIKEDRSKGDRTDRDNVFFNRESDEQQNSIMKMFRELSEQNRKVQEQMLNMMKEQREADQERVAIQREVLAFEREQKAAQNKWKEEDAIERRRLEEKKLEYQKNLELARLKAENERRAQEAEMRIARQAIEAEQRRQHTELLKAIANRPPPKTGGCLKSGTMIMSVDGTQIPVEDIQIGDVILNHKFEPTRVISALRKFLLNDQFFGFDEYNNNSYFFTNTHLIGGKRKSKSTSTVGIGELEFYVEDIRSFYHENPLLKNSIDVYEFNKNSTATISVVNKNMNIEEQELQIITDPQKYPQETLVYILQVDSPSGTYIANGVVCRHEMPPLELWPNTIQLLLSIAQDSQVNSIMSNIEYTIKNRENIIKIVHEFNTKVEDIIKIFLQNDKVNLELYTDNDSLLPMENIQDVDGVLMKVFNDQTFSVLGMEMYSTTGKILANVLDNSTFEMEHQRLELFKQLITQTGTKFLRSSLSYV